MVISKIFPRFTTFAAGKLFLSAICSFFINDSVVAEAHQWASGYGQLSFFTNGLNAFIKISKE